VTPFVSAGVKVGEHRASGGYRVQSGCYRLAAQRIAHGWDCRWRGHDAVVDSIPGADIHR
jgi:hypothetical protein